MFTHECTTDNIAQPRQNHTEGMNESSSNNHEYSQIVHHT